MIKTFRKEGNLDEMGIIHPSELDEIIDFDPNSNYLQEREEGNHPSYMTMFREVGFSAIEQELGITLHPSVIDYFTCLWADFVQIRSKKIVSAHHSNDEMYLDFLSCPSAIYRLQAKISELNTDIESIKGDEMYIPIGRKLDG